MAELRIERPDMQRKKDSQEGFTRVELVMVVGAIGLLLSIPLSAVSRSRDSSSATLDLNNVRQIMAAMAMYTGDNTERLPYPTWGWLPSGLDGWAYAIENKGRFPGLPERIPSLGGSYDKSPQMPWAAKGQIAPYLESLRVLECPKDVQERADPFYEEQYGYRLCKITSYNWSGAILQHWPRDQSGKTVKISEFGGSDILQWEANEINAFNFNDAGANPGDPNEAISQRHGHGAPYVGAPNEGGGAGTVGYFGGGAELMRHREFVRLRESGTPNALLCGPGYR